MEVLYSVFSWGSPVGLGLWFLLTGFGCYLFLIGLAKCIKESNDKDKK